VLLTERPPLSRPARKCRGGLCRHLRICYTGGVLDFLAHLTLPGYRVLLVTGLVLGTALAVIQGRRRGLATRTVVDGALAAAVGGMLIGRTTYIAAHWLYFRSYPGRVLAVWHGGLSAPGVVVGAVTAVVGFSLLRRDGAPRLLDALAPGAALLVAFGWLGCLGAGCSYGLETRPGQECLWSLSAELPDAYDLRVPRVAVQGLGVVWNVAVLALNLLLGRRGRPFPLWLFLHASGDFGLAFLRGDLIPLAAGLAAVQLADLVLGFAGLALLGLPMWHREE
jgi:phosphatidylglycerol:prolipoprotein diacylglycerol transferase